MRIFVSAAQPELVTARKVVADTLIFMGFVPVLHNIPKEDNHDYRPQLQREIDQCQGVIQLVGELYGAEPPTSDLRFGRVSYTQYEACYAKQRGKPIWFIFVDKDGSANSEAEESDRVILQAAYRRKLQIAGSHPSAANDDALEATVLKLREEIERKRVLSGSQKAFLLSVLAAILLLGNWMFVIPVTWRQTLTLSFASSMGLASPAQRTRDGSTDKRSSLPTVAAPSSPPPSLVTTSQSIPREPLFSITDPSLTQLIDREAETHFVLRFGVRANVPQEVEPTEVKIQVFLYDLVDNNRVMLTDADVGYKWLEPQHDWQSGKAQILDVSYIRLRTTHQDAMDSALRSAASADASQRNRNKPVVLSNLNQRKYLGYIVRVYYKGQLATVHAEPNRLQALFPPPLTSETVSGVSQLTNARTLLESAPNPFASSADFASYSMKLREQELHKLQPDVFVVASKPNHTSPYPWKTSIVTLVFWIGESTTKGKSGERNRSAWDATWLRNYGGVDKPQTAARRNFIPKAFIPHQNPFYCGLPYNDIAGKATKPEAGLVIPWYRKTFTRSGETVCKDQWVAVRKGHRICYAQWEDCGPFSSNQFQYVFQNERPKPNLKRGAGLEVSPAVRDYLGLASTDVTDWQFTEVRDVPRGPWRLYGDNNHFVVAKRKLEERQKPSP